MLFGSRLFRAWKGADCAIQPSGRVTCQTERAVLQQSYKMFPAYCADLLGLLLETSPLAIVCLDSTGNVQVWSRSAEAMLGWREQEVIGRPAPVELQLPADAAQPAELRLRKR